MNIIGHRKIFYLLSGIVILLSLLSVVFFRFRFGIDFVGGTFWELQFSQNEVASSVFTGNLGNILVSQQIADPTIQTTGTGVVDIRFGEIDEPKHQDLLAAVRAEWPDATELQFETVGPTISTTLRTKAVQSIILVIFGISLYIAWAFRRVSRPLASWKYGVATVVTLFHDVIVPIGLFSFLGHIRGIEVDSNFIVALLVVMGFSVHDTIVVFDRIRENLHKMGPQEPFTSVVNQSVNETITRSINTSMTTLLALAAVLVWGSGSLTTFILAMMVGIFVGTYSSIFIASPLLVEWEAFRHRR